MKTNDCIDNDKYEYLTRLLKAETHQDVIELMFEGVDKDKFDIKQSDKWCMVVAKDKEGYPIQPTLSAHTDTVSDNKPTQFKLDGCVLTNPDGVLGADDRAGIWIINQIMRSKYYNTYHYVLFDLEERGGVGSNEFVLTNEFQELCDITSVWLGLDRRGCDEAALYGYDNEKMTDLLSDVGYRPAIGSFTDVATLADNSGIACANLSVGYNREHTKDESLDMSSMYNTYEVLVYKLPDEFWQEVFDADETAYLRNTKYSFKADTACDSVCCDICDSHVRLYDVGWGFVCDDCLEYADF